MILIDLDLILIDFDFILVGFGLIQSKILGDRNPNQNPNQSLGNPNTILYKSLEIIGNPNIILGNPIEILEILDPRSARLWAQPLRRPGSAPILRGFEVLPA